MASKYNRNRRRIGELVSHFPGIHLRRMARILDLQESTARYHLGRLEKDGKILCSRDGEYLRAFPTSMNEESERQTFALLQRKAAREVLKGLLGSRDSGDGVKAGRLAELVSLSESTVSEYLKVFRKLGIVRKVMTEEGRWEVEVAPENRARLLGAVLGLEKRFVSTVTDSYIDLWDF